MSTRIKQDDIIEINEAYLRIGTYSGVAKELGYSPSTVKKYVQKDYISQKESFISPPSNIEDIEYQLENNSTPLSVLQTDGILNITEDERIGIYKIWGEMSI